MLKHSFAAAALVVALFACGSKTTQTPVASSGSGSAAEVVAPPAPTEVVAAKPEPPAVEPPAPPVPAVDPKKVALDAELVAYKAAEPVFVKHCARCHKKGESKATDKKLKHFDMTGYPFGGHHVEELAGEISAVLGIGGRKATMPIDKPGAVKDNELALISAWIDAWNSADKLGAHTK